MSTVLNEYSYFIDSTIAKNAGILAQCDRTDAGTDKGVWKTRAKLKLDVSEFNKQLNGLIRRFILAFLRRTSDGKN